MFEKCHRVLKHTLRHARAIWRIHNVSFCYLYCLFSYFWTLATKRNLDIVCAKYGFWDSSSLSKASLRRLTAISCESFIRLLMRRENCWRFVLSARGLRFTEMIKKGIIIAFPSFQTPTYRTKIMSRIWAAFTMPVMSTIRSATGITPAAWTVKRLMSTTNSIN